jgi:predicted alpha-1,2-mannosidase
MKKSLLYLFPVILAACTLESNSELSDANSSFLTEDLIQYVDPFIGTGFHGHTFPGPSLPRGMVQLSPDTRLNGWDASSGYHYSDSTIYGFSHTHLSGTGIGDMGDVLLLPFTGAAEEIIQSREDLPVARFRHKKEEARPGYYKVEFDNYLVEAELTATSRVGMHRYTFSSYGDKMLLLDIGHILQRTWGHENVLNQLEVVDPYTLRGLKHSTGWSHDHQACFHMEFSSPFHVQQVNVDGKTAEQKESYRGQDLWSLLQFSQLGDDEPLLVKVAISPVDTEGARSNMEAEIPHWNFEEIRYGAETIWNEALGKIRIDAMEEEQLSIFYTSLYHTLMAPTLYQDADGRYRGMDGEVHHANPGSTNYTAYSLWDTFRAFHPLMTLIDEEITLEWANNLLLKYQQGGILPKWPLAASYTGTMIAYPAVAFLTDVVTKEMEGIDPEEVLEAALVSASWIDELPNPRDNPRIERMMPKHNFYVNQDLHIPADQVSGSVSYGLEMAYYDWCIARLAALCGKDSIEAEFMERSRNYTRYFDSSTGFMRGKNSDGSWITPFNPRYSDHEDSPYVEGNAWQWSWFVPHDPDGLMDLHRSVAAFEEKLDSLFSTSSVIEGENASGDITGLIGQYAHGNEPSHHIAYYYIHAGAPWKTQELVDSILHAFYSDQPDGIIGNEDCGQMSAWYILNAMGIYQVAPGDPVWAIGRPLFHRAEIDVAPDRTFTIKTMDNSRENRFVQQVKLNGKEKDDLYLRHQDIIQGGVLEIQMGNESGKLH